MTSDRTFDGEALRRLRVGRHLSAEDLARRVGASRQAVTNWEEGRHEPRFDHVKALAKEFGLSVEYFLKAGADAGRGAE